MFLHGSLPLDTFDARNLEHVEADHRIVVHDDGMVGLDEAHTAHVCCQIEHMLTALHNFAAVVVHTQIYQMEFVTEQLLLHSIILRGSTAMRSSCAAFIERVCPFDYFNGTLP